MKILYLFSSGGGLEDAFMEPSKEGFDLFEIPIPIPIPAATVMRMTRAKTAIHVDLFDHVSLDASEYPE